jgi:hypothetical protein
MYEDSPYFSVNTLRFAYNKTGNVRIEIKSRRVDASTVAMDCLTIKVGRYFIIYTVFVFQKQLCSEVSKGSIFVAKLRELSTGSGFIGVEPHYHNSAKKLKVTQHPLG